MLNFKIPRLFMFSDIEIVDEAGVGQITLNAATPDLLAEAEKTLLEAGEDGFTVKAPGSNA